jgi:hypothetical protein
MIRKSALLTFLIILTLTLANSGCFEPESSPPGLGDYAEAYLSGSKYKRILIEIDYVEGYEPSQQAKDTLVSRLYSVCDKDDIIIMPPKSFASSKSIYSLEDIKDLEKEHRTYQNQAPDMVAYVLYLDGESYEKENVLGRAYGPSSIVIFKEKIDDIPIPIWGPAIGLTTSDYETSVIVHEFGHLLSLVNYGYKSERGHEDSGHEHHCTHENCVMYYAIDTVNIYDLVVDQETKPPSDFYNDCWHDLDKVKRGEY